MKLTLNEIAMSCGAALVGPAGSGTRVVAGYSIDSRSLAAGELFFAICGEKFDGHSFVASAVDRGATGVVIAASEREKFAGLAEQIALLVVEDTLVALQQLAASVRRQWGKRVIAVTGSAGKTTTKDAIALVLEIRYKVLKSKGNLNNGFGLPLQLLRLEPEHDIAVVEMGMNHPGEIAALARIGQPDWGVVTNVGSAHIENFLDGQAGIARSKYELVESLPATGIAFLNCDDAYASQFGRGFLGQSVYFGSGACADPQVSEITEGTEGIRFQVKSGEKVAPVAMNLLGRHNALNAAAAIAVGAAVGIPLSEAAIALGGMDAGDKRGEMREWHGARIINDCYNSNPEALQSMIGVLAALKAERRILIAGEMLELGTHAVELHARCGRAAAEAGIDLVVGVRGNAEHLVAAARETGRAAVFVADATAAGKWMRTNLRAGDAVLLKGSRGVGLERALSELEFTDSSAE
jgi:UDP-N-acetylmuramoyl-tripeptide--D-alanyl-D-alanine ligase